MYIELSDNTSIESAEVSPGVVLDYDEDGQLVGIDIDNAKNKMALRELILSRMPVQRQVLSCMTEAWLPDLPKEGSGFIRLKTERNQSAFLSKFSICKSKGWTFLSTK